MDQHATGPLCGALRHLGLLRFTGPDASPFLQGQVSNDTTLLAPGRTLLCALSSPQGRVQAVLNLVPHDGDVVAILPDDRVAAVAAELRRFILRSKVRIEERPDGLQLAGGFGPGEPLRPGCTAARLPGDGQRFWMLGPPAQVESGAPADAGFADRWRLADIRAGLPQVYAATAGEFVAQMLNLDLVDGISFRKGCYTGQEIIARTQHLGRIKRRMLRVAIDAAVTPAPAVGGLVRLADGRSGHITEIAPAGGRFEALAVMPLEATVGSDAGVPASLLALPYPLG